MAIDYDHIMSLKLTDQEFSYGDRESMLYALGVGMGRDPLDESELAYTCERDNLKTVPSMAAVLTRKKYAPKERARNLPQNWTSSSFWIIF